MRITLERETWEPRTRKRPARRVWARAWVAELLYADARIIVTRSAGSHQFFFGNGEASSYGYKKDHPVVARLGLKPDRWGRFWLGGLRIAPASLERIQAPLTLLNRITSDLRARKRARSGKKKGSCKPKPKYTRPRRV